METGKKQIKRLFSVLLVILLIGSIYGTAFAEPRVIYVDADANDANNGTSWEDAYTNLQDALDDANITPGCEEIRAAQGVYYPSELTDPCDEHTATFKIINCVAIKGGYAGFGEPDPNARDIREYETILSGDLEGNDGEIVDPFDPCRADNSYNVIEGNCVDNTATLDGFTITGGNAIGGGINDNRGGGMHNYCSSPTVRNCLFEKNSADYVTSGGGMCNEYSSPIVTNCIFKNNWAGSGGGMYNWFSSNPTVTNCTFVVNGAYGGTGGIDDGDGTSSSVVTNCILWGNDGEIAGADPCHVNYNCIQGGYEGVGNIDADPMFAVDGYHLTLCSLCIDAGDPNYVAGDEETDTDGEQRIMDSDCNGNARVDMGVDEYYPADCNVFLRAHCPGPDCRAAEVLRDAKICWRSGLSADKHDVYFGTDYAVVRDANDPNTLPGRGRQDSTCYDPFGLLDLDTTYYWRIDEVDGSTIRRGDVWHFLTVQDYNVVDNFNGYATSAALLNVWKDFTTNGTCAEVYVETVIARDGNSMKYLYWNYTYPPYYSEAYADIDDLPSGIGSDWRSRGRTALSLWFRGVATNPANEEMYVKLHDVDSYAAVIYGEHFGEDQNYVRDADNWHEWNIDLEDFNSAGVDLTNVTRITIGFGDGPPPATSDGTMYFDDIRLYTRRCRPEMVAFDMDGNCKVDWRDLEIITNKWLDMGCCEDLYKDDKVNLDDFAILAEIWLQEGLLSSFQDTNQTDDECFPDSRPDYANWVTVGRPDCWCCLTQCHGDINCDGVVNSGDLIKPFEPLIGAVYPNPTYDPCFDFNHDKRIAAVDLNIFKSNYNSSPPSDCLISP